eukprot:gnl/TRDRNA2_/TRDRNA2_134820_c0_seq1.p1 gnl/TRDRNA2_/TRDRNA2_134820_c0~~gnl/TRDRNA2_/TRDRNA2_134820_c0_seq1.p1  ORF type:complete len:505 (-),score=74.79 gnl/TRDRNA2_/TRDRNA2_134820_c0_seq1:234-1748(-)
MPISATVKPATSPKSSSRDNLMQSSELPEWMHAMAGREREQQLKQTHQYQQQLERQQLHQPQQAQLHQPQLQRPQLQQLQPHQPHLQQPFLQQQLPPQMQQQSQPQLQPQVLIQPHPMLQPQLQPYLQPQLQPPLQSYHQRQHQTQQQVPTFTSAVQLLVAPGIADQKAVGNIGADIGTASSPRHPFSPRQEQVISPQPHFTPPQRQFTPPPRHFTPPRRMFASPQQQHSIPKVEASLTPPPPPMAPVSPHMRTVWSTPATPIRMTSAPMHNFKWDLLGHHVKHHYMIRPPMSDHLLAKGEEIRTRSWSPNFKILRQPSTEPVEPPKFWGGSSRRSSPRQSPRRRDDDWADWDGAVEDTSGEEAEVMQIIWALRRELAKGKTRKPSFSNNSKRSSRRPSTDNGKGSADDDFAGSNFASQIAGSRAASVSSLGDETQDSTQQFSARPSMARVTVLDCSTVELPDIARPSPQHSSAASVASMSNSPRLQPGNEQQKGSGYERGPWR